MDFFKLNFRNVCEGYISKYFFYNFVDLNLFTFKKYKTFFVLTDTVTSTRVGIEKTRVCVETRHPQDGDMPVLMYTCIAIR